MIQLSTAMKVKQKSSWRCFQNIGLWFKYKLTCDFSILPRTVLECFVWQLFRKGFPQGNKGTECSISNTLQTEQLECMGALRPMHQSKGKLSLEVFVPKSQPKGYLSACYEKSVRSQLLILYVHDLMNNNVRFEAID